MLLASSFVFFFFNDTATTEIYTLSLHDALPIFQHDVVEDLNPRRFAETIREATCQSAAAIDEILHTAPPERAQGRIHGKTRSEEHTSELQSPCNLVCRLLLEKKKTRSSV